MAWFTIIKGGLDPKEGKQGKHMTKMFMFLHRFFGKPAWGVETTISFDKDTRDSPSFDKYYATFEQLNSPFVRWETERFLREIESMESCYNWESINWDGVDFKTRMPGERIPGLVFSWHRPLNNTIVTVTFDKERHIKVRDNMYRNLESKQQKNMENNKGVYNVNIKQPFRFRPQSKEELEVSGAYRDRNKIGAGEYGKYERCLQRKYKNMEEKVKRTKMSVYFHSE
jgi:hypothetical protein